MGCFLACFGLSKKRKRRKTIYKVLSIDQIQRHGSYEALDSSKNITIRENPTGPDSHFREECKEKENSKIIKKVRFNLNVQTYEPISTDYHVLESSDREEKEKGREEAAKICLTSSLFEGGSKTFGVRPAYYRYQNCRDSYIEEDEIEYEDFDNLYADDDEEDEFEDADFDYDYDYDGDVSKACDTERKGEISEQSSSSLAEDKTHNQMPFGATTDTEVKSLGSKLSAQEKSQCLSSVLSPVENLTQWKAMKARAAPPRQRRKENVPEELNQLQNSTLSLTGVAVDASLSNWLVSPSSDGYATIIRC